MFFYQFYLSNFAISIKSNICQSLKRYCSRKTRNVPYVLSLRKTPIQCPFNISKNCLSSACLMLCRWQSCYVFKGWLEINKEEIDTKILNEEHYYGNISIYAPSLMNYLWVILLNHLLKSLINNNNDANNNNNYV